MTDEPLPIGFACPTCEYDLGAATGWICPECGRYVNAIDIAQFEARQGARAASRRLARVQLACGTGIALFSSLALLATTGRVELWFAGFASIAAAAIGSIGAGWLAAFTATRAFRSAWRQAWLRAHCRLHLPWMIAPGVVLLPWMVQAAESRFTGRTAISFVAVTTIAFAIIAGLAIGIYCTVSFNQRWEAERRRMGLGRGGTATAYTLLVVMVIIGSLGLGAFWGGMMAAVLPDWSPLIRM